MTEIQQVKKPCIKCGSTERNKSGACGPCVRANSKRWYEANKEKHIANTSARRSLDKPKSALMQAQRRAKNIEAARERDRSWYSKNAERLRLLKAEWRKANYGKFLAIAKAWRSRNKEAVCIQSHNRRAKIKATGGKLTRGIRLRLFQSQKGKCPCCRASIVGNGHLDHIVPLALHGANEDSNIQLLCQSCNHKKSSTDPVKYMQKLGFLL